MMATKNNCATPTMAAFACATADPLKFTVKRNALQLVCPASPTPDGVLYLSNLDDQNGLRFYTPAIQFFMCVTTLKEEDPAKVIREAVAKALVHFYPFAGRLRPSSDGNGKLVLDCSGEGVAFVEGDADVSLHDFFTDKSYQILPPFPYSGELIDDVVGSTSIIDSPPVFIQVTRLTCGGFIFAISLCHCIADGIGMYLFVRAIGEMAMGALKPSIPPVWERERLLPRSKPCVKYPHYEYKPQPDPAQEEQIVCKSFVFGKKETALLKRLAKNQCNTFEALAAYLWRLRTKALRIPHNDEVRLIFTVDIRGRLNPPLPLGYYGNAISLTCAMTRAGDLINQELSFATKLVQDAKDMVVEDYVRSVIDLMELNGRVAFDRSRASFIISDLSRLGMRETDYGWGRPLYGGPARAGGEEPGVFMVTVIDTHGLPAIAVPLCLPCSAMHLFQQHLLNDMQNFGLSPPRATL